MHGGVLVLHMFLSLANVQKSTKGALSNCKGENYFKSTVVFTDQRTTGVPSPTHQCAHCCTRPPVHGAQQPHGLTQHNTTQAKLT